MKMIVLLLSKLETSCTFDVRSICSFVCLVRYHVTLCIGHLEIGFPCQHFVASDMRYSIRAKEQLSRAFYDAKVILTRLLWNAIS